MSGGKQGNNPWAWLGLLKWSLQYTDGTADSSFTEMSPEDRLFLEKVMKDGILDENERMKEILKLVAEQMETWKENQHTLEQENTVNRLLQELRDFVEQIDYARAFAAMKGLDFLLGSVQERQHIPQSTRCLCLGILATLSSNNPPVQTQLLEMGALKALSNLYFAEMDSDPDATIRTRTIQAISAMVRSHELAERVFCQLEQAPLLIQAGLGTHGQEYSSTPQALRQRTLFLLRALVTSDSVTMTATATKSLVEPFCEAVGWVADFVVDDTVEPSPELREMALAMLQQILELPKQQTRNCNTMEATVMSRKDALAALGVRRIAAVRALTGEEAEFAAGELEHWEAILVLLAKAG